MPGRDRTGPVGLGPMTGRGLGYCRGENDISRPPGRGWGYGRGRRFRGQGRGFGYGYGYGFGPYRYGSEVSQESEMALLRDQINQLKREQEELEKLLRTMEKKGKDSEEQI